MLIVSFMWNYYLVESNNSKIVLNKSQAFFEQILISRAWNAEHGGVYVPTTATTLPNQYLKDSLRDLVTTDGLLLTKINPSYMTRQIADTNKLKNDLQFHITSLNPIRPANIADSWETKTLNMFENGVLENIELITNDSTSQYRYMAPLPTEKSCLKCHSEQGYKYGDIRGGISISFPANVYTDIANRQLLSLGVIHLIIFILGMIGLLIYYSMAKKYLLIIENKNNDLIQINATKDKLFSIIAHDLRSPFNTILGYIDLLKSDYEILNENERRKYINIIDKSADASFQLLENLLLWSSSQSNKIEIVKEELNLRNMLTEAIAAYLPGATMKNINVTIRIPDDLIIYADNFTIKSVMANLFNNAVKFTSSGGDIKIDGIRSTNFIQITIYDNGIGIPEEVIPKLFQIETNISTLGTNKEKGSGLGLLLCKEFIEKNGGRIWIESEFGKGTKAIITIPEQMNKYGAQ